MKNDNITTWCDALATTEERQVTGALAKVIDEGSDSGKVGFCCLGFGTCEVMGHHITVSTGRLIDHHHPEDVDEDTTLYLDGVTETAPFVFRQWLGLIPEDADEYERVLTIDGRENRWAEQKDVFIDWPTGEDAYPHAHAVQGHGVPVLLHSSCADLNDEGFTFAQIADVVRYFGLLAEEPNS